MGVPMGTRVPQHWWFIRENPININYLFGGRQFMKRKKTSIWLLVKRWCHKQTASPARSKHGPHSIDKVARQRPSVKRHQHVEMRWKGSWAPKESIRPHLQKLQLRIKQQVLLLQLSTGTWSVFLCGIIRFCIGMLDRHALLFAALILLGVIHGFTLGFSKESLGRASPAATPVTPASFCQHHARISSSWP